MGFDLIIKLDILWDSWRRSVIVLWRNLDQWFLWFDLILERWNIRGILSDVWIPGWLAILINQTFTVRLLSPFICGPYKSKYWPLNESLKINSHSQWRRLVFSRNSKYSKNQASPLQPVINKSLIRLKIYKTWSTK
jgi:hypothetical protein